ncbi:hypothetical protein [Halobaculum saliterrae]|uniref:hypothetical protein n=1 Tax=Halobaculum saliterrae TaxID=2073113 RepID=UPI001916B3DD|nr:hypothetical protein [Halobaculum saliterrae]
MLPLSTSAGFLLQIVTSGFGCDYYIPMAYSITTNAMVTFFPMFVGTPFLFLIFLHKAKIPKWKLTSYRVLKWGIRVTGSLSVVSVIAFALIHLFVGPTCRGTFWIFHF